MLIAEPVERGCGRRHSGIYLESGTGPGGKPLEHFLIDPPEPLSEGLDLVNKMQPWFDETTGIYHVLKWVGAEHYPHVCDIIEETRRYGASFRGSPLFPFHLLTPGQSRLICAHPRALNTLWREQLSPLECHKNVPFHTEGQVETRRGPCLFKTYELIPKEDGVPGLLTYVRQVGSTIYAYAPTDELAEGLTPGFFARLPLTGIAFIRDADGKIDERAKMKVEEANLPYYESDE